MSAARSSPAIQLSLSACARALEQDRHVIAASLSENACLMPRWAERFPVEAEARERFIEKEGYAFIDYLVEWLRDGNDTFRNLYIGEKLKQLYDEQESSASARMDLRKQILSADSACFARFLGERVSADAVTCFMNAIEAVHEVLVGKGKKVLDVLFIGDCIFLDVMSFIAAPCMEEGIEMRPCFATSKNPADLGRHLRSLGDRKFDVVFYSPFTYRFDIRYGQLLRPAAAFMRKKMIEKTVDEATDSVGAQIRLIADLFDCPIHIHNAANVLREGAAPKRWVKNLLTRRTRRRAARRVDQWLRRTIKEQNARSFEHLYLFDEIALARPFNESELGGYFYQSDLQHPCYFSKIVASEYADLLTVHAHLVGKKLVVCDLDNTLWDGVIGEGAVAHYHDRQSQLLELKARGVVLSVNSKNDPDNVVYDDGTIQASDFVYSDINWEPKVHGISRTEQALNLKTRDFVFIEDRADEREMARMAFPELVVFDSCQERTWRLFAHWARFLDATPVGDRTTLYKERESRRGFLKSEDVSSESSTALFQSLQLRLSLRGAAEPDLQRVHDLINRTNQFNLCGSRVNYGQVREWSESVQSLLLVAAARDRFGDMGTIGVLVLERAPDNWDIPVFVLSCRVFGYGIERAMLNHAKIWAQRQAEDPSAITGTYRDTGSNRPCRSVYPENGFVEQSDKWCFDGGDPMLDAEWLTIESDHSSSTPGSQ